jgi:glycosyltransferase involved in cell wall biosynthesis
MKNPLVSIIVAVFNEEKYLNRCLQSLKNQSYKDIEIIIVDDGSTDKSRNIIKQYNVKYLSISHSGPGVARNKGAQAAKGEILVFVDADMYYDKEYIKELVKPIVKKNICGTFSKEEYVANKNNIWSKCWSINAGLPIHRRVPQKSSEYQNVFRAIQKKLFLKVKGFDTTGSYFDDTTLSKKLNKLAVNTPKAISFHYNPETLLEVFYSGRWIGRSEKFSKSLYNILRFSPFNSLRVGIQYVLNGAPVAIVVFKQVYDFGMFVGIFLKTSSAK